LLVELLAVEKVVWLVDRLVDELVAERAAWKALLLDDLKVADSGVSLAEL
jgi:hypothetical protein